jgi:RNA polymerase sigma-70 factor, ECF subfamily
VNTTRNTDEFVRLFSQHTNSIYSYIHAVVPFHADAEDVFQEVSRTLWEKFGEYRPGPDSGFRAWALRIAQIEILRYRQREGRRHKLFSDRLQEMLDKTAMTTAQAAAPQIDALDECYEKLPVDDRQLLDARYRIGATVEVIAKRLGRSVHSIYRSLRRIHQVLFDCMESHRNGETDGPVAPGKEPLR